MIALNKYHNFLLLLVSFSFSQILISQSEIKTMALMKNPYMKMENIQGYEFDEANQCMLLFQVFNVNKTSLIQEKTEPCNSMLETLHPKEVTSGKQNVLYKRIMASIQGLAKGHTRQLRGPVY